MRHPANGPPAPIWPLRLQIPIVMVVGVRLGCLNHALLTQEAILSRGLRLAGWIANVVDPDMPQQIANISTLQARLHAPCWRIGIGSPAPPPKSGPIR